MAQLSFFDKLKHYSNKDITYSIGSNGIVYMTFRNNSWKAFTASEYIRIWAENGKLNFGDGTDIKTADRGRAFKLVIHTRRDDIRYVQFKGRLLPDVFEIIDRTAGSYDIPKKTTEEKPDEIVREAPPVPITAGQSARDAFMQDARELLATATTSEERTAIYNALGAVYGIRKAQTTTQDDPDKWDI